MAQSSKVFRVFVSSTFSDLEVERNALQKRVFPSLRALCMRNGCRFQAIDLRWGLSTEAGLDQQTMKICLEEIKRCQRISPKPNFIVLLGDRYGWKPLPYEISGDEYVRLFKSIENTEQARLLNEWYIKDENAVPCVYCLKPREDEFEDQEKWNNIEKELHGIMVYGADKAGFNSEEKIKYTSSATEQEIIRGALKAENSNEHIFGFFRTIKNLPDDKSAKGFIDLNDDYSVDENSRNSLNNLKCELSKALEGNIEEYEAVWEGNGLSYAHIDKLCDDVEKHLNEVISKGIGLMMKQSPIEKETAAHYAFCAERSAMFQGREEYISLINSYISGGDTTPLILFGASGTGKSALMAKAIEEAVKMNSKSCMVYRFIGATSDSSDIRLLLKSVCQQIAELYGSIEPIPDDYNSLVRTFNKFIGLSTREKPLCIYIDALDQLENDKGNPSTAWLPVELPRSTKIVISTLPGEYVDSITRRYESPNLIELLPMRPDAAGVILDSWLNNAGRTLQDPQKSEIIKKFSFCPLPLYLKLAFNEAVKWHSYDKPESIGSTIPDMVENMLTRLSDRVNHGPVMVPKCLGYIAASRHGLSEDEILDLLSLDDDLIKDYENRSYHALPEQRLPVVVWSRLYFDLEHYLTERSADGSSLFSFYHRQIQETAARLYCKGEIGKEKHKHLSNYFMKMHLWNEVNGVKTANARKASELPFQLAKAGMLNELESTLTDLDFIEAKSSVEVYDLISDYDRIGAGRAMLPADDYHTSEELSQFGDFVRKNAYIFSLHPQSVFQQAMNSPDVSVPARKALELISRKGYDEPWLKWKNKPQEIDSLIMTITGFEEAVQKCLWSPDGTRLISWSGIGHVEPAVWDAQTGRFIANLSFERGFLGDCEFSPDSKHILLALNYDGTGTAKIVNAETGKMESVLEESKGSISSCSYSPDGNYAAVAFLNGTVNIYHLDNKTVIPVLEGEYGEVSSCCYSPDGRRLAIGLSFGSSEGKSLIICDAKNGRELHAFNRNDCVNAKKCSYSPDGKRILVELFEYRSEIKVFSAENYKLIHNISMDGFGASSCCYSPDGRQIAINNQWELTIVDADTFKTKMIHKGHSNQINWIAYSPDGAKVLTCSGDKTMKIWYSRQENETVKAYKEIVGIREWTYSIPLKCVAVSSYAGLSIWDLNTCRKLGDFHDDNSNYSDRKFLPGGADIIVAGNARDYSYIKNMLSGQIITKFIGHMCRIGSMGISPDCLRLLSSIDDSSLIIWDMETGVETAAINMQENQIKSNSFSLDGSKIVTINNDRILQVWNAENGQGIYSIPTDAYDFICMNDGMRVITSNCFSAKLIDITKGTISREIRDNGNILHIKCISPDGRSIIMQSSNAFLNDINILDTASLQKVHVLFRDMWCIPGGIPLKCSFSPDGRYVVSSIKDGSIRVFSSSGQQLSVFYTGAGSFQGDEFLFAFNCKQIITANATGNVFILEMMNFPFDLPVLTAVRRYSFKQKVWESNLKAQCEWCGSDIVPNTSVIKAVERWNAGLGEHESPCLGLSDDAYNDSNLIMKCPNCGNKVRFNPYFVDNSNQRTTYSRHEPTEQKAAFDEGIKRWLRFKLAQDAIMPEERIMLDMLEGSMNYNEIAESVTVYNDSPKAESDAPKTPEIYSIEESAPVKESSSNIENNKKTGLFKKLFGKNN